MATKDVGELRVTLRLTKDKFEQGLKAAGVSMQDLKDSVDKTSTAMLALGAAMSAAGIFAIKKAADFETLRTRLQALFVDTEKGNAEFDKFVAIAGKVPFTLQSIVEAGATLAAFLGDAKDRTSELLPAMADLAAFMGVDVPLAAASFGRAFAAGAGAADMLRDRGVLALVALKGGFSDAKEMVQAFQDDLPGFRKLLVETLTDPNLGVAGATERLSKTLKGQLSMLKDAFDKLAASIGDTVLPEVTQLVGRLTKLTEEVNRLPAPVKKLAVEVALLGGAFLILVGGTGKAALHLAALPGAIRTLTIALNALRASLGGVGVVTGVVGALGLFISLLVDAVHRSNQLRDGLNLLTKETDKFTDAELEAAKAQIKRSYEYIEHLKLAPRIKEQQLAALNHRMREIEAMEEQRRISRSLVNAEGELLEVVVTASREKAAAIDKVTEAHRKLLEELDFEADFERWKVRQTTRIPTEPSVPGVLFTDEDLRKAREYWSAMDEYNEKVAAMTDYTGKFKTALVDGVGVALSDILVDAITDFDNAFQNMGERMLRMIAQIIGELMRMKLVWELSGIMGIRPVVPTLPGGASVPSAPPGIPGGAGGQGAGLQGMGGGSLGGSTIVNVRLEGDAAQFLRLIQRHPAYPSWAETNYQVGAAAAASR